MKPILPEKVQELLTAFSNQDLYIHLETTNGAYASHHDESFFSAGAFLRNAIIRYEHGKITGNGPYRIGLKLPHGWVYAEGLTHFETMNDQQLLIAGYDNKGKLAVALQLSITPFS